MSDNVDFGMGEKELRFYCPKTLERKNIRKVSSALSRGLVPSVSTVLNSIRTPHLETYMLKQAFNYYLESGDYNNALKYRESPAAEFGTECHQIVEDRVEGCLDMYLADPYFKAHLKCIQPLFDWMDANVKEVIFNEAQFADSELGYGGTADMLVKLNDGRQVLCDFKFKKHSEKYPMKSKLEYAYQLSAYAKHFEKTYGRMDTMNLLVAAPSDYFDGQLLKVCDYGSVDYFEGFKAAYKVWYDSHMVDLD